MSAQWATGHEVKAAILDRLRWRTSTKLDRDAFSRCVVLNPEEAAAIRAYIPPHGTTEHLHTMLRGGS